MAKTQAQSKTISVEDLQALADEITKIDTQIAAATGSDAAIRKGIAENLATENAETVDKVVAQIVAGLESMSLPVVIGLRSKLDDVLNEKFDAAIKEFLDGEVEKATSGSKDDLDKLKADRKEALDNFRALKTILDTFKFDTSSVPEPKSRRGGGGGGGSAKSGKNKEGYQFTMDGKNRPPSQNSFSSLAFYSTLGCAGENDRWGVAQLKDYLVEKGVKYGEDDTWEVELPNKTKIGARRFTTEELAAMDAEDSKSDADEAGTTETTPEVATEPAA